jgi:hypothetical protein
VAAGTAAAVAAAMGGGVDGERLRLIGEEASGGCVCVAARAAVANDGGGGDRVLRGDRGVFRSISE